MCETEVVASLWSESQRTGNNQCGVHLEDLEKSGSGVGAGGKVQGLLEGKHEQEMRLQAWDSLKNGARSETPLTGAAPLGIHNHQPHVMPICVPVTNVIWKPPETNLAS